MLGIGYDFIPIVCDRDSKLINRWIKTTDKPSFEMSRRLIAEEGLLCGTLQQRVACVFRLHLTTPIRNQTRRRLEWRGDVRRSRSLQIAEER